MFVALVTGSIGASDTCLFGCVKASVQPPYEVVWPPVRPTSQLP